MNILVTFTCLPMLFCLSDTFGQDSALSKHEFNFYINDLKESTRKAEISIIVSGDTIKALKKANFYYFPIVDTSKNFDIIVKIGKIIFLGPGIKSWVLNRGTRIFLGRLTQLNKLVSVAEYNGMTQNDKGWEAYSKRFFVIDGLTTIDIENRGKIRELQFLLLYPNNSKSNVCIQKTIKYR